MGGQGDGHPCQRCGSSKVIPRVPLLDHIGDTVPGVVDQTVEVAGSPGAWLSKDKAIGTLRARICGECGHVELSVENHQELYAKYLKSLGGEG